MMKLLRLVPLLLALLLVGGCASTRAPRPLSEKQERAMALFAERCKTAGEFIYGAASGVEGILLMKLRPDDINYDRQYTLDDPYGHDVGGDGYIASFLRGNPSKPGYPGAPPSASRGYKFVEATEPSSGQRIRYTGALREVEKVTSGMFGGTPGRRFRVTEFVLDRSPPHSVPPRFGVTFEDISTREDREHWIAGSALKVLDLQSGTVIAQRIGYMVDPAQGNRSGGRAPWLLAARNACPSFPETHGGVHRLGQTLRFVEKVLVPKQGAAE